MTEPLTDGAMRDAFADLRAAELPHIAPPGAGAARRSVRRRRYRTVGALAATATIATVGSGYLAVTVLDGNPGQDIGSGFPGATPAPSPPPTPSLPPTPSPATSPSAGRSQSSEPPDPGGVCDQGGSNDTEQRALDAISDGPAPIGSRYNTFLVEEGAQLCGYTLFDTYDPRLQTDSYLVQVWCGDEFGGSATVTLRAGDTEVAAVAGCAMTAVAISAGVGEAVLNASADHEIEVSAELAAAAWADGARPILKIVAIPQGVELPRKPGS